MNDLLDLILDNTARQRLALVKLFLKHNMNSFSRDEIWDFMNNDPYEPILTRGFSLPNPFHKSGTDNKIPTILRDRLRELVDRNILEMSGEPGTEKTYRLSRNVTDGSLEGIMLKREDDISMLSQLIQSLAKYKELPFADLLRFIEKQSSQQFSAQKSKIAPFKVVDFETPFRDEQIIKHSQNFHEAICERQYITKIEYEGHYNVNKKPETILLHDFMPYLLKQSRGQWYLVGKCIDDVGFRPVPVNRIVGDPEFDNESEPFAREEFNPEKYWEGCLGITRLGSPLTVSFEVKNGSLYNNIDYIRTVPIVKGHQHVSMNGEWMKVVLDKIYIGPELIREIRSFGRDNIRNVSPSWLEEDLWESGRRDTVRFSIKLSDKTAIPQWKKAAEKQLRIGEKEENESASISVVPGLNKKGWYTVTLEKVLINSILYFFFDWLSRDLGDDRIHIRDRQFPVKK